MTKKTQITIRDVESGSSFFVETYKLSNFNINVPKYTNTVHWHDHFEMEIVDKGKALHVVNGDTYAIGEHDAYLVTPADIHTLHPFSEEESYVDITNIGFNEAVISEGIFNELMKMNGPLHATLSDEVYQSFQYIIGLVKKENTATEGSQNRQRMLCNYLVLKFMELHNSQTHIRQNEPVERAQSGHKNYMYINKAISYIKYNFRNPKLTTRKVAHALFLTPNYFGEMFYKHMNITCLDYIRKLKLNFAISLLQQSNITISEIAEKSGYTNTSYFIKEFKNEFGMTPQIYRNQMKDSASEP